MTTTKGGAASTRLVTGVFAKRPRAGEVKTRLEPALGAAGAAAFARALLDDAARRLDEPDLGLELVFAPAEERAWFAMCFPGHRLTAQRGEGLAARLEHWFAECLGGGRSASGVVGTGRAELAIAVGSDSPWTSAARVRTAADLLEAGKDVVLGPDLGGGYYLVGLRRPLPGLFTDITMSTRSMRHETQAWLEERGLTCALLEEDYDVDTPEDLRHLRHELADEVADSDGHAAARGTHRPNPDDPSWPHAVAACLKQLER